MPKILYSVSFIKGKIFSSCLLEVENPSNQTKLSSVYSIKVKILKFMFTKWCLTKHILSVRILGHKKFSYLLACKPQAKENLSIIIIILFFSLKRLENHDFSNLPCLKTNLPITTSICQQSIATTSCQRLEK